MFNRFVVWLADSPLHALISSSVVVVSYRGMRSGRCFSVPVNYAITEEGGRRRIWITSQRNRVWWRNFVGGREAELVLDGESVPASLHAADAPEEVEQGLIEYLGALPKAARYFDVGLDEDGQPRREDIQRAAGERVILYADL